jgi:hypothetical protein
VDKISDNTGRCKMACHGCNGRGWVDSQYAAGPALCPICRGTGLTDSTAKLRGNEPTISPKQAYPTKNNLANALEQWLVSIDGVRLHARGKSMNGYYSYNATQAWRGLVWVETRGGNRIHLRKGDYTKIDIDKRVIDKAPTGKPTWGGYPIFALKYDSDVEYAKKLLNYAKDYLL